MRSLLFTLVLLLLLPIAFGINVQADETEPPDDPGNLDNDGDLEGDHPWGSEENASTSQDYTDPKEGLRPTLTFEKYIRMFVYVYYGLDFLDSPATEQTRSTTLTRFNTQKKYSYRSELKKRSR